MIFVYESKTPTNQKLIAIFERQEDYLDAIVSLERRARDRDSIITEKEINDQKIENLVPNWMK